MNFYVFPHPAHRSGRQSAVGLRCCGGQLQQGINRVQARARVQHDVRRAARGVIGWGHKRGAALVAPGEQQSGKDVGPVLAPKDVEVSFENRPQADTGPEPAIIEQQRPTRNSVRADDALVAVNRQQHAWNAALGRRYRDDPLSTELLSKKSLLYGSRRSHCKGAGQRVRSFREFGIYRRYIQDCHQLSVDAEHRRAGAAQVYVSRSEMLVSVDGDGALFDDASADAVRALHLLGPDAAEPSSPIFKTARLRVITAMLDGNARAIAEKDRIPGVPNQFV